MPNIIGEPIHDYVAKQINKRQKAHGSGQDGTVRTPEQIAYLNSKTAWVKLASGVSLDDARVTEEKLRGGTAKVPGSTLATRYVLFNGTSHIENGYLTQRGTHPTKDNVTDYYTGTYNVNALTENSEFGLVPMPGIESAEIKCLNRGSIKRATVKIKCYSPEQFQILDLLYMRIGYTMLLEWGNSLYLSNSKDGTNELQEMGFTLVEDPDGFFKQHDQYTMLNKISQYREAKSGNYDAMLGKVVNFSWQFAQDGSYDITLDLISWGDVVESLKCNVTPSLSISNFIKTHYTNPDDTSSDPAHDIISAFLYMQKVYSDTNNDMTDMEEQNISSQDVTMVYDLGGTPTKVNVKSKFVTPPPGGIPIATTDTATNFASYQDALNWVNSLDNVSTPVDAGNFNSFTSQVGTQYYIYNTTYAGSNYTAIVQNISSTTALQTTTNKKWDVVYINYNNGIAANNTDIGYYMRLGHFLDFIQQYVIPKEERTNSPLIKIDTTRSTNRMFTMPYQVSLDPRVCIVNSGKENVNTKQYFNELAPYKSTPDEGSTYKEGSAYIMNIYVNHNMLMGKVSSHLDEHGNLKLFDFINEICTELNKALGDINNLEPVIDETTNTLTIIDNSYNEIKKGDAYGLELYGYNHDFKSSNFVRNFNLKTEITPDFATMATIGSTAGGYVKGVENTMFSKWNRGIVDRYKEKYTSGDVTSSVNEEDVREKYVKEFWMQREAAFGLTKNSNGEIELNDNIIEKNISTVSEFYKYVNYRIHKDTDGKYASPTNGFIPVSLGITMDGISGIKIYNSLAVATRFLPPKYPENMHFIIKGVNHKLSNSDWETSIETVVIAKES